MPVAGSFSVRDVSPGAVKSGHPRGAGTLLPGMR